MLKSRERPIRGEDGEETEQAEHNSPEQRQEHATPAGCLLTPQRTSYPLAPGSPTEAHEQEQTEAYILEHESWSEVGPSSDDFY